MRLLPYAPFALQAVRLAVAADVAVVVVDVIGGNRQAELGDTNTFAALGGMAYGLAGADTNGIVYEAAEDAQGVGGEEVKDGETVEGGGHGEGVVAAEGNVAVLVAVVGKRPAEVGAAGAVGGGAVGNVDSSVDMEAIGLEGVVLEEVLVVGVDLTDPIDRHGSTDIGEGSHSLGAVVGVERQRVLSVVELLLPVPAFATSTIQPHSHGLV